MRMALGFVMWVAGLAQVARQFLARCTQHVTCIAVLAWCAAAPALAADVTTAQQRAAEEFLALAARGGAAGLAPAIHPDELDLLRRRLLKRMKLEEDRGESTTRARLFGPAMPLAELERMTSPAFYAQLARQLTFGVRVLDDVRWLAAVPDQGGMVHVVGRGRQPREHGETRVPVLVSLVPWGKDWKAALPLELQAQIDDLMSGRVASRAGGASGQGAEAPGNPAAVLTLLQEAEAALQAGRCEAYYERHMSPHFRRATGARALRTLINACENRAQTRETLIAALRAVREASPRLEYGGTRAVYDLRGQGLPFDRFVLEQVEKRWYVAE